MTGEMKTRKLGCALKVVTIAIILATTSGCGGSVESNVSIAPTDTSQDCTPGYNPCLPPMSDYDCKGGQGDGPGYTGRVEVYGDDIYKLDRDDDGIACS